MQGIKIRKIMWIVSNNNKRQLWGWQIWWSWYGDKYDEDDDDGDDDGGDGDDPKSTPASQQDDP